MVRTIRLYGLLKLLTHCKGSRSDWRQEAEEEVVERKG